MFFIYILNVARRFFFFLGVVAESEDDEGIPLSILSIIDDLVFFGVPLQNISNG